MAGARTGGHPDPGPGFPRPRRVDPGLANARWDLAPCHHCGMCRASLTALRHIEGGDEVRTSNNPAPAHSGTRRTRGAPPQLHG